PAGVCTPSLHDALPICERGRDRDRTTKPGTRHRCGVRTACCKIDVTCGGPVAPDAKALILLGVESEYQLVVSLATNEKHHDGVADRKSTRLNSSHVKIS